MSSSDPSPDPSAWKVLRRDPVADCRVFRVKEHHSRRCRDGTEASFFVIHSPDWVNTVAVTPRDEVVMVRQFRYGVEDFTWEIPGGVIDKGESPLVAGVRELSEETGFTGAAPVQIGQCRPNPAILNNTCHFVLVENAHPLESPSWDHHEELEIRLVPLSEVWQWLREGRLSHVMTQAALLHYGLRLNPAHAPTPAC